MSLRFADNFAFWTTQPGTFTTTYGSGVVSTASDIMTMSSNGGVLLSDGLDAQGTWIINIRFNAGGLPVGVGASTGLINPTPGNAFPIFTLMDGTDDQISLCLNGVGKLQFYKGATAVGTASTSALATDAGVTYYDLEAKVVLGNSGSCALKINGGLEINNTSTDTTQTTNNTADGIIFGFAGAGSSSVNITTNWQHIVVMDSNGSAMNDYIGPVNVNLHTPNADGTYTTWTASAGSRYQCVDETTGPNGDTDYVSSAAVGNKVSFALTNTPAGVTSVKGACAWINAKRDDATTRGVKILLRYSGSDQLGTTELFVGPAYLYHFQQFDVSPFSAAAWTTTEIDGVEVGAQITT